VTLAEVQEQLRIARRALAHVRDNHLEGLSPDTAFATGEALGMIRHAQALLARDIATQALSGGAKHG
jgi:hypothetical protein